MTNSSARLTVLLLLALGLTSAQLKWSKVTLSEEPNEDWIYSHRSMFAYNIPKGETFQPSISLMEGDEGEVEGVTLTIGPKKAQKKDLPDPLRRSLYLQANVLLYGRDGTFLGGTNLFQLSSNRLKMQEFYFGGDANEVEFYIEMPSCGRQRFTKSSSTPPVILINPITGKNGLGSSWSIINYASPECPEVFGAIQFVTSRDQFDLDLHYKPYYIVQNWRGGYVIYPFDDHNDFIGDDVITNTENFMSGIQGTMLS